MEKEYILEVRALTWDEHSQYEEFIEGYIKDNPGVSAKAVGRAAVKWILDNIYPESKEQLTAAEAMAVYNSTMALSDSIRGEEIKNLKLSFGGSTSEEVTAQTAEK